MLPHLLLWPDSTGSNTSANISLSQQLRTPAVKHDYGRAIPPILAAASLEKSYPAAGDQRDVATTSKVVSKTAKTANCRSQIVRVIAEKESFMKTATLNQILRLFHELLLTPQITGNPSGVNSFSAADDVSTNSLYMAIKISGYLLSHRSPSMLLFRLHHLQKRRIVEASHLQGMTRQYHLVQSWRIIRSIRYCLIRKVCLSSKRIWIFTIFLCI